MVNGKPVPGVFFLFIFSSYYLLRKDKFVFGLKGRYQGSGPTFGFLHYGIVDKTGMTGGVYNWTD